MRASPRRARPAARLIEDGDVLLDGRAVKPAQLVHIGDRVSIRFGRVEQVIEIRALGERRGPAAEARLLYVELATTAVIEIWALAARRRDRVSASIGMPRRVYAGNPNPRPARAQPVRSPSAFRVRASTVPQTFRSIAGVGDAFVARRAGSVAACAMPAPVPAAACRRRGGCRRHDSGWRRYGCG